MKKTIIALAAIAAMGAAQAQVAVYGLVDLSYGKNETIGDTKANFHSGGDNGSSEGNSTTKFGIKGSTDVGSGVQANFKLESGGITSDGQVNPGGAFFNRAAWAGLSGSLGEVRLGRQDSVPFQTMTDFDFNGASNAASAQMLSMATPWSLNGRQSRSLQYIAPAMGGLSVQAGYQPESDNYGTPAATATDNKTNYSLGMKYKVNQWMVAVAGESARSDSASSFSSAAASYDFGVLKAEVGYANGGSGSQGANIGVVAPINGFNVGLTYAKNSDATGAAATEFYVNRQVFKNTYAYFDYGNLSASNADFVKGNAYALGMIYTF